MKHSEMPKSSRDSMTALWKGGSSLSATVNDPQKIIAAKTKDMNLARSALK